MGFYLDVGLPANVPAKFELCIALPVPEIIAIEVLGGVANPNLGEEEAVGVGDATVRKSVGEFLWALHSNFSSIFTRFRDIATFVLQPTTFSHPSSSYSQISSCSPGSRWVAFGLRRAKVLG